MAGRMGIRVSQAKQLGRRRRESGLEAALFEALAGCSQKFLLALLLLGPAARMFAISSPQKFFGPAAGEKKKRDRNAELLASSLLVLTCKFWPKAVNVRLGAEREITGRVVASVFEGAAEEWHERTKARLGMRSMARSCQSCSATQRGASAALHAISPYLTPAPPFRHRSSHRLPWPLVHHQHLPCRSSLSHPLSTGSAKIYLMQSP